jgi:hypothetical protein
VPLAELLILKGGALRDGGQQEREYGHGDGTDVGGPGAPARQETVRFPHGHQNTLASKHSPLTRLPPWASEVRDRLLLWVGMCFCRGEVASVWASVAWRERYREMAGSLRGGRTGAATVVQQTSV